MATILIIDDSQAHRKQFRDALDGTDLFDRILEAHDGIQGLKALLAERIDVVLCDVEMPGLDGEKLLRVKHASPGGTNIPFLFVTASQDLERKARLLEGGACDAIDKPFHPPELVARLRLHLKIKQLQDELVEKNESLALLSTTDALTGLRNRRYLNEAISVEFMRARRYHTPFTVLMADIDHFKELNDSHGHQAGDAVLRAVGLLLQSKTRATDVAVRYGGEEFVVLLSQSPLDGGVSYAQMWRNTVRDLKISALDGSPLQVTISIGVAGYNDEMKCPEDLIEAADVALYRAKRNGRDRVEVSE